jgi:hypothetical protein
LLKEEYFRQKFSILVYEDYPIVNTKLKKKIKKDRWYIINVRRLIMNQTIFNLREEAYNFSKVRNYIGFK